MRNVCREESGGESDSGTYVVQIILDGFIEFVCGGIVSTL